MFFKGSFTQISLLDASQDLSYLGMMGYESQGNLSHLLALQERAVWGLGLFFGL